MASDPLTASVLRGALGGAKQALNRETGYRALETGERQTDGPDNVTMALSTPGSVWRITVERVRTS